MSKADEMMIDLGYKKVDLGFLFSRFWEQWEKWENVDLEKTISFNIEHKYFKVEDENEYGITIQELQAINEKVKELRLDRRRR